MKKMTIAICITTLLSLGLLAGGCAQNQGPSNQAYQGGAVGAGVGAAAGALLDDDNRWRGGVIGGALGAVLGGAMGEISHRAAQEAAAQNQPVYYENNQGGRVEAYPQEQNARGCQVVKEKYYDNGRLVKVTEKEVCP